MHTFSIQFYAKNAYVLTLSVKRKNTCYSYCVVDTLILIMAERLIFCDKRSLYLCRIKNMGYFCSTYALVACIIIQLVTPVCICLVVMCDVWAFRITKQWRVSTDRTPKYSK